MTTFTQAVPATRTDIIAIFAALCFGIAIIVVAGHAQASSLHDAAHDTRHAAGFPCH